MSGTTEPPPRRACLRRFCGLLLCSLLSASAWRWGGVERLSRPLTTHNLSILDASIQDTFHLLLPVGIIKGAADVIEGSVLKFDAGIVLANAGVEVEVGDSLAPVLSYINLAWNLLLLSMVYLLTAKAVLTGAGAVGMPLLTAAFLLATFAAFPRESSAGLGSRAARACGRIAQPLFAGALFFLLILPLTVSFSGFLSLQITEPLRADLAAPFETAARVFSMEEYFAAGGLKERAVWIRDKSGEIAYYAQTEMVGIAVSVGKLAAVKLLNGLVSPLGSLLFLLWMFREGFGKSPWRSVPDNCPPSSTRT